MLEAIKSPRERFAQRVFQIKEIASKMLADSGAQNVSAEDHVGMTARESRLKSTIRSPFILTRIARWRADNAFLWKRFPSACGV